MTINEGDVRPRLGGEGPASATEFNTWRSGFQNLLNERRGIVLPDNFSHAGIHPVHLDALRSLAPVLKELLDKYVSGGGNWSDIRVYHESIYNGLPVLIGLPMEGYFPVTIFPQIKSPELFAAHIEDINNKAGALSAHNNASFISQIKIEPIITSFTSVSAHLGVPSVLYREEESDGRWWVCISYLIRQANDPSMNTAIPDETINTSGPGLIQMKYQIEKNGQSWEMRTIKIPAELYDSYNLCYQNSADTEPNFGIQIPIRCSDGKIYSLELRSKDELLVMNNESRAQLLHRISHGNEQPPATVEVRDLINNRVHELIAERELRVPPDMIEIITDSLEGMRKHQTNTPLTVIIGYAQLLAKGTVVSPEELKKHAQTIVNAAIEVQSLIYQDNGDMAPVTKLEFLDLARILPGLLESIRARVERSFQGSTIHIINGTTGNLPVVAGIRDLLGPLIENVLSNAVKYSQPSQRNIVTVIVKSDQTWITNTETGLPEIIFSLKFITPGSRFPQEVIDQINNPAWTDRVQHPAHATNSARPKRHRPGGRGLVMTRIIQNSANGFRGHGGPILSPYFAVDNEGGEYGTSACITVGFRLRDSIVGSLLEEASNLLIDI